MPRNQLQTLKNRHLAVIDFMLDNPTLNLQQIADQFKMSAGWLSYLTNSDVFKQAMADRRAARQDYADYVITRKLDRTVEKTLSKLEEVLDAEPTPGFILKATEILLTQRGHGTGKQVQVGQGPGQINVNVNTVSSELLAQAQQRAKQQYLEKPVEDAEVVENEKLVHPREPAAIPAASRVATDPDYRKSIEHIPAGGIQVNRAEVQCGEEV